MYEQMYKLDEVLTFFEDELSIKNDERITSLYNKISNPHVRVNANDKQWVASTTDPTEVKTVLDAIQSINGYKAFAWMTMEEKVKTIIVEVGKQLEEAGVVYKKPRIPFYIMVLDRLAD